MYSILFANYDNTDRRIRLTGTNHNLATESVGDITRTGDNQLGFCLAKSPEQSRNQIIDTGRFSLQGTISPGVYYMNGFFQGTELFPEFFVDAENFGNMMTDLFDSYLEVTEYGESSPGVYDYNIRTKMPSMDLDLYVLDQNSRIILPNDRIVAGNCGYTTVAENMAWFSLSDPSKMPVDPYMFIPFENQVSITANKPVAIRTQGIVTHSTEVSTGVHVVSRTVPNINFPIEVYNATETYTYDDFNAEVTTKVRSVQQWGSHDWGDNPVSIKVNPTELTNVPNMPPIGRNLKDLFYQCAKFNDPNVNSWNTSNVTNFEGVFSGCTIFNQPLTGWDTSKGTTFGRLFDRCNSFNQSVAHFDTANATSMFFMFNACFVFNQPLTSFNTAKVTDFGGMFRLAKVFQQPLSHFDTGSGTNFKDMFSGATVFNLPLNSWNMANAIDLSWMFSSTDNFNQPLADWNVGAATNMDYMFNYATAFKANLSKWCVANIASEPTQFRVGAGAFVSPVWGTCPFNGVLLMDFDKNTDPVRAGAYTTEGQKTYLVNSAGATVRTLTGMEMVTGLVAGNYKLYIKPAEITGGGVIADVSADVYYEGLTTVNAWSETTIKSSLVSSSAYPSVALIKVPTTKPNTTSTTMEDYFSGCTEFNDPSVITWNVSTITNFRGMFKDTMNFNQPIGVWNVGAANTFESMFNNASAFNQNINAWNMQNAQVLKWMFNAAVSYNQPMNNWKVGNVSDLTNFISEAQAFAQDLTAWCVTGIPTEPPGWTWRNLMTPQLSPVWGTCPNGS